jgi:hypothetical protein
MMKWLRWWFRELLSGLKDFRPGWDEADLQSAKAKQAAARPGDIVYLTHREMEALRADLWRSREHDAA